MLYVTAHIVHIITKPLQQKIRWGGRRVRLRKFCLCNYSTLLGCRHRLRAPMSHAEEGQVPPCLPPHPSGNMTGILGQRGTTALHRFKRLVGSPKAI